MRGLVSVEWLAQNLRTRPVAVLDASWHLPNSPFAIAEGDSAEEAWRRGPRVPGARFWDVDKHSDASVAPETPHNLPSPSQFASAARACGLVDAAQPVVIYDSCGVFSAPRLWYTLKCYGFESVAVLDGGLPAWLASGAEVETGPVRELETGKPTASFARHEGDLATWALSDVRAWLEAPARPPLLDARPSPRFDGTGPEPRPGVRSGHMPGTLSLPFTKLLAPDAATADAQLPGGPFRGARLADDEALRAAFAELGVDLAQPLAVTCGSGLTAAVLALAAHKLGAPDVALYDGAWLDYEAQPDTPIATNLPA